MAIDEIEVPQRLSGGMLKTIDLYLDDLHENATTGDAGKILVDCKMDRSQVRGLENIIVSTGRFSEIINYVKNQTGKEKKENKWRTVGPILITQLEQLEKKASEIAEGDMAARMEVKLRLARGWARQVVAYYLYGQRLKG